jgi:hypothetical protein
MRPRPWARLAQERTLCAMLFARYKSIAHRVRSYTSGITWNPP